MNRQGTQVFGVVNHDGDTSGGQEASLYLSGMSSTFSLGSNEVLFITDIQVITEGGGDIFVDFDSGADGAHDDEDLIVAGNFAANQGVVTDFQTPRQGPPGKVPKLFGAAQDRDTLIFHGYVGRA
jgi:hypothetical protein